MAIASVNPANGETLQEFDSLGENEIERRIALATAAFAQHRRSSFSERARGMNATAALLEGESEKLARIITSEMGKPLRAAKE